MANAKYDTGHASACYINIAEDGSAKAGMILENGEVLTVALPVGENRAESTRKTVGNRLEHKLVLERDGESIVRQSSFFGIEPAVVEEFSASIPRGKDFWFGGSRQVLITPSSPRSKTRKKEVKTMRSEWPAYRNVGAECHGCGTKFFHVLGESSHTCEKCGGLLNCGYDGCQPQTTQSEIQDKSEGNTQK